MGITLESASCAAHDRKAPSADCGDFTINPLHMIEAHPTSLRYIHFDVFTVMVKGWCERCCVPCLGSPGDGAKLAGLH